MHEYEYLDLRDAYNAASDVLDNHKRECRVCLRAWLLDQDKCLKHAHLRTKRDKALERG